jgi:hypothetical protein
MSISQRTELARAQFEMNRPAGQRAGKMFLGMEEQRELLELAVDDLCRDRDDPKLRGLFRGTGDARVEFRGLKVYQVDDQTYLEVAP